MVAKACKAAGLQIVEVHTHMKIIEGFHDSKNINAQVCTILVIAADADGVDSHFSNLNGNGLAA